MAEIASYYENLSVGLAVLGADLRYRRVNKILAERNGIPAAEHIGRTMKEVVPSLAEQAQQTAAQIRATGEPVTTDFIGETAAQPGVQRTWREGWYPLKNEGGEIAGFMVIIQDIAARK